MSLNAPRLCENPLAAPAEQGHLLRHQLVQRDLERLGELLERFHFGILIHARFQLCQGALGDSRPTGHLILR
jgi:hypothetical protein